MMVRVLAAAVVAVMWTVVRIMDWMDPEEYDDEAEEADWPEPDFAPDSDEE
jgi:hypothetical protein